MERGEQAAEEFEARLRAKSGGTVIIKREKTTDGSMGKILGTEKKKEPKRKTKKKKKEGEEEKGKEGSSDSENESEASVNVHSDKTASEGVKEEGMVWGQMEERQSTTAVTVVGNAVDLGTKAVSGAMKGAIWGRLGCLAFLHCRCWLIVGRGELSMLCCTSEVIDETGLCFAPLYQLYRLRILGTPTCGSLADNIGQ